VLRAYPPLRSDMKVLDAGCGSGLATLALRDALAARSLRPGPTHGFDLTPAMLERFRANLDRRGLAGVELREADVLHLESLPEAWSGYDLILSSAMLEHVPRTELPTALGGLRRRLADDGSFLLFISRRNAAMRWLIERWWSANLYSRDEIAACLDRAGFSRVGFLHFPPTSAHLALWGHVVEARP
jgi:SAM-dependent methyltransferase